MEISPFVLESKRKLFSVLLVSYKNLPYIYDAINSVLEQDYSDIELIICDDGTEEFREKEYIDYITLNNNGNIKNLIVHKNEVNSGTTKNMNTAIKLSKGEYIKILAADDALYDSTVLSSFADYFDKADSSIVVSKVVCCDENLTELKKNMFDYSWKDKLKDPKKFFIRCCKGNFIGAPGVCYTKKLFQSYGCFDEKYILLNDWPMWLRLSRNGCRFGFLDIVSAKYRIGSGVSTTGKNKVLLEDLLKCFNNEMSPYKDILGSLTLKKIKFTFIRHIEFSQYSTIRKISFVLKNLDAILFVTIPDKIFKMFKVKV